MLRRFARPPRSKCMDFRLTQSWFRITVLERHNTTNFADTLLFTPGCREIDLQVISTKSYALRLDMDLTLSHPELTPQCWAHVFSQLPVRDAARSACVQKLWKDLVMNDEHLWRRFMLDDLGLSDKRNAAGFLSATSKAAYTSWRHAYGAEYWPYLPRAIKAWDLIKDWLAAKYPAVRATVQGGLSEAEVAEVEASLGFTLPPALKVLYRLHDGQALKFDAAFDRRTTAAGRAAAAAAAPAGAEAEVQAGSSGATTGAAQQQQGLAAAADADAAGSDEADEGSSIFHGLFGGYSVYNHMVVTRMMPLRRAAVWRTEMQLANIRPTLLPFACSFRVADKMFVADAASGCLSVIRRRPNRGCALQPAVPQQGPQQQQQHGEAGPERDGVLRWFEEYARRLAGGSYEVAPLDDEYPEDSRAISLFPLRAPEMVEAVTRGVRVCASVVYVPEAIPDRHMFAYAIRFALLDSAGSAAATQQQQQGKPAGSALAASGGSQLQPLAAAVGSVSAGGGLGWPVQQCQLVSRHWVIRDERGGVVDEVQGEGVIGKYPVLRPGEPEFVYCSCTHQAATRGSMEGEFRFVEGTIDRQTGPNFDVTCPTFRLDVPAFTF